MIRKQRERRGGEEKEVEESGEEGRGREGIDISFKVTHPMTTYSYQQG
jgi:hypothetical protein